MAAAAIPIAIAGAQIGFSAFQGYQQAKAQEAAYEYQTQSAMAQATAERKYQEQLVEENERLMQENEARAIRHFNFQNLTEDMRLQQLREILAEDSVELRRQGLTARGQAAASAATRGATGQSVELMLADIRAQEGRQRASFEHQFELEHQGSVQRRRGFDIELEQNATAVQPFVPAPINVQRPMAPTVSPFGGFIMGGTQAALNSAVNIGLPTLRSFQNSRLSSS